MTIATTNAARTVDINLYGPVIDAAGWFTDETKVITPHKVKAALDDAANAGQINVHINSPGGSVFAGQAIYNMIRQHPANVTVYVDGIAASIASIIAMAGNKIIMPPGAMMMVHNPLLSIWGAYEASDMREMADFLDKVKESLVATYQSRVKNKTKDEIVAIMDATTWLTAADAVDMGFADEIEGLPAVTASMSGTVLNIGGINFDLSGFDKLPVINLAAPKSPTTTNKEEETLNLEDLKSKYPELYNQVLQEGVTAERTRMKALDDVQLPGHDDLVNKARYESGASAQEVAMQIIAVEKSRQSQHLQNTAADVQDANLTQVPAAATPDTKEQESKAAAEKIANLINEGRK